MAALHSPCWLDRAFRKERNIPRCKSMGTTQVAFHFISLEIEESEWEEKTGYDDVCPPSCIAKQTTVLSRWIRSRPHLHYSTHHSYGISITAYWGLFSKSCWWGLGVREGIFSFNFEGVVVWEASWLAWLENRFSASWMKDIQEPIRSTICVLSANTIQICLRFEQQPPLGWNCDPLLIICAKRPEMSQRFFRVFIHARKQKVTTNHHTSSPLARFAMNHCHIPLLIKNKNVARSTWGSKMTPIYENNILCDLVRGEPALTIATKFLHHAQRWDIVVLKWKAFHTVL